MAFNPFNRRPVDRPTHTRTFTDGNDTFTLTFRKPGQLDNSAAFDRGEDLIRRYLGTEDTAGTGFPPIGGVAIQISETAIRNAVFFEAMQPPDASERYTADEFIAMQAVLSDACWSAVSSFADEVRKGAAEIPPTSGAVTEQSSEPASDTQSDTPNT